jgi:riboflavin kinase / FMN adenylyltransferase
MKVYHDLNEFEPISNAVVTIGTFDGVHVGHQHILSKLKEIAAEIGGETVILTFFPHPRMILHPEDQNLKLITTMAEKAELLEKAGIDHLIITPFTRDFSNLSAEDYIQKVLIDKIGTRRIVVGYDHRFGKDRTGGLEELIEKGPIHGFEVLEIPEQDIHAIAVSSTQVRKAILAGEVSLAHEFLGYPFMITGKVVRGDQIGRSLGYPTANLFVEEAYKLIPADGIYAVQVTVGTRKFSGMAYIGHRPTINGMYRNIEVNIFDFDEDIYDQSIRLHFLHFLRGDEKFSSLDDLKVQLGKDKHDIMAMIS